MFGSSVTMNMSQRIGRPLVHLPPKVTSNLSQLGQKPFATFLSTRNFSGVEQPQMKRCTYCGKEYPDEATKCMIDHQPLASSSPEPKSANVDSSDEVKTVVIRIFGSHEAAKAATANLEAHGIECWVNADDCGGMYPNLTVAGGVRLLVHDLDAAAATALLDTQISPAELNQIEADAVATAPPEVVPANGLAWVQIILGIVVGIVLCLLCQQAERPGSQTIYSYTPDGKRSEAWVYQNDHLVEFLKDGNLDGHWDYWDYYQHGIRVRSEMDNNFDGKPDEWWTFSNGEVVAMEKDTDFNGTPDLFCTYSNEIIQQADFRPNGSKFVTEREIYENGVLTEILRGGDSNGIFKEDVQYDPFFNPISTNANGMRWISLPAK